MEEVDSAGTDQTAAVEILRNLRDQAFDSNNQKLALALGRPVEEVEALLEGRAVIDDDVVMKARGIALNRGASIESDAAEEMRPN
jgi:plasmid maintenance system antidote protein VapI